MYKPNQISSKSKVHNDKYISNGVQVNVRADKDGQQEMMKMETVTKNEWSVLTQALNYDDRGCQLSDNFSNCYMDDMMAMGWSEYKIGGVVSQLQQKKLGFLESKYEMKMRFGDTQIFYLTEAGVNFLFDIYENTGNWNYPFNGDE